MRIVMMGTGPFAVPTFRQLLRSPHAMRALVTRPVPPPVGNRRSTAPPNPMRELAEAEGLEVYAPPSINDESSLEQLRAYEADLFVVCDYGQILSPAALQTARLGGINLHASLLPKYRGAAPINWAIYRGEAETGITVIHMTPRLDAGPCVLQRATPIGADEDAVQLEHRLAEIGAAAVIDSLPLLEHWDGQSTLGEIQSSALATKAPRLKKTDGWVDWQQPAEQIARQVRAFKPWPGTFTEWQRAGQPLRLLLIRVTAEPAGGTPTAAEPGTIVEVDGQHAWIACGAGTRLRLDEIQPAGKGRLPTEQFLRGYPLAVGDRCASSSA